MIKCMGKEDMCTRMGIFIAVLGKTEESMDLEHIFFLQHK